MNARFDWWCKTAVDQIRYSPDRKAVYEELYAHLEDRYEAELDLWETPEEAAEATLKAMGSASELAPQLAAVHRPFWGSVLTITRWMLLFGILVLGFVMVIFALSNRPSEQHVLWFYENPGEELVNVHEDGTGESRRVMDFDPDSRDSSDGFSFDVSRAVMTFSDNYTNDEEDAYYFYFQIDVSTFLNWSQLHEIPLHDFWAVDSLGNRYCSYNDYVNTGELAVSGNLNREGPFSYTMDMWLVNFCSEEAEWIEIRYDREGREIALRIDLTGGAAE